MNVEALRVFNGLYKLGITEEEFQDIEEEQTHSERTGLYIACVKKGKIIAVSHDEKHKIVIKLMKGKIHPVAQSRILFKTLITFKALPDNIYTLHAIAQYHALDGEIKHIARNIDELKDRVCDRFADEYPKELGEAIDDIWNCPYDEKPKRNQAKNELVNKQLQAIFWLFDEEFCSIKPSIARLNIPRLTKVFSRNNRRVALIQKNEKWDKHRGGMFQPKWKELIKRTTFQIKTYKASDDRYNYVAPDREVFYSSYPEIEIWLSDEMFEKITEKELQILAKRDRETDREWFLLTADEFNKNRTGIRVELMSARRKQQEEDATKQIAKALNKEFSKGKIVRHGITFNKDSIEYDGTEIKGNKIRDYILNNSLHLQETPNFNDLFEGYVDYVLQIDVKYSYSGSTQHSLFIGKENLTLGKIKICLETKGSNFFINSYKIRREDAREISKRVISYSNQADFDAFVKQTGRVNLSVQKALKDTALTFNLKIDNTDDNCLIGERKESNFLLSLPFFRKDGKNYVSIEGVDFKVKNTQALMDLGKEVDCRTTGFLQRTIKLLYQSITGITHKEIGDLIKNGKAEYRKATARQKAEQKSKIDKSKKFIEHAINLTKAKKVKGGYLVRGLSKIIYFVNTELKVWTTKKTKNGKIQPDKYLCIVDDDYINYEDEARTNDRIAKRLLMLSKDKVTAREIWENGDKMDTHWKEIMDYKEEKMEGSLIC